MLQLLICSDFCTRYPDEHITVLNVASGGVARLLDYLIRMFWMWWQMELWHRARERGDGYSLAPRLTTNTSTRYKIFLKVLTIMLICSYVRGHTRQGGRKHSWDVMVSTTSRPVFFLRRLSRYTWLLGCFCPSIVKCQIRSLQSGTMSNQLSICTKWIDPSCPHYSPIQTLALVFTITRLMLRWRRVNVNRTIYTHPCTLNSPLLVTRRNTGGTTGHN